MSAACLLTTWASVAAPLLRTPWCSSETLHSFNGAEASAPQDPICAPVGPEPRMTHGGAHTTQVVHYG